MLNIYLQLSFCLGGEAQLAKWLLPTPQDQGSNPVNIRQLTVTILNDENEETNGPFKNYL